MWFRPLLGLVSFHPLYGSFHLSFCKLGYFFCVRAWFHCTFWCGHCLGIEWLVKICTYYLLVFLLCLLWFLQILSSLSFVYFYVYRSVLDLFLLPVFPVLILFFSSVLLFCVSFSLICWVLHILPCLLVFCLFFVLILFFSCLSFQFLYLQYSSWLWTLCLVLYGVHRFSQDCVHFLYRRFFVFQSVKSVF